MEVYQVSDQELKQIEETYGHVGQDLTFAIAFFSFGLAFLIALLTATLSEFHRLIFINVVIICGVVFLYTGIRWWRTRKTVPNVIANIRSRKPNPEVPSEKPQ
jgi:threonine/homoserine/homoserine lactone efflux protein